MLDRRRCLFATLCPTQEDWTMFGLRRLAVFLSACLLILDRPVAWHRPATRQRRGFRPWTMCSRRSNPATLVSWPTAPTIRRDPGAGRNRPEAQRMVQQSPQECRANPHAEAVRIRNSPTVCAFWPPAGACSIASSRSAWRIGSAATIALSNGPGPKLGCRRQVQGLEPAPLPRHRGDDRRLSASAMTGSSTLGPRTSARSFARRLSRRV